MTSPREHLLLAALPTTEPPLFELFDRYAADDVCSHKHGGSETSEAAHEVIRPVRRLQHQAILDNLAAAGRHGRTCAELSERLMMAYTSVSARLSELKRSGDVVESGEKRPTPSGCLAFVVVPPRYA